MTNLTEKWKKGELPFGAYYVNRLEEHRIWLYSDRRQTYDNSYEIYEVLAPVPSYEQWQELKEYERIVTSYNMKPIDYDLSCRVVTRLLDEKKELRQENTKLKELLKECREEINYYTGYNDFGRDILSAKINQVLGEE